MRLYKSLSNVARYKEKLQIVGLTICDDPYSPENATPFVGIRPALDRFFKEAVLPRVLCGSEAFLLNKK